jgi:hypothetical protein
MASGEATKVWFKEIDAVLLAEWHAGISSEEIAALANKLTVATQCYREQRGIKPPMIYCRTCGTTERANQPVIRGGSLIFAARRLGLIDEVATVTIHSAWERFAARQRRSRLRHTKDTGCALHNRPLLRVVPPEQRDGSNSSED